MNAFPYVNHYIYTLEQWTRFKCELRNQKYPVIKYLNTLHVNWFNPMHLLIQIQHLLTLFFFLPDKIQSISAPYFLRGCCGDISDVIRPPLLRDFSRLFLAPFPYCRIADAGIWRLYSTSPSWVIRGSWRRERRAYEWYDVLLITNYHSHEKKLRVEIYLVNLTWTAFKTPAPCSKWVSSSSIERIRGAA